MSIIKVREKIYSISDKTNEALNRIRKKLFNENSYAIAPGKGYSRMHNRHNRS